MGPPVTSGQITRPDRVALAGELADFILALSGSFQKFVMYPQGHPALEGAVKRLYQKLQTVFLGRNAITVGVTPSQLIISGVPTDPKQVLLRDLAHSLHKREIGGIKILKNVTRGELEEALAFMSRELKAGEEHQGSLPYWTSLRLYPLSYDHLELLQDEEDENNPVGGGPAEASWSRRLWLGLVRATLGDDISEELAASTDIDALAATINAGGGSELDDRVLQALTDFAENLRHRGRAAVEPVQRQMAELLLSLTPESTQRLLALREDGTLQRNFLLSASHVLSADVILRLIEAVTSASNRDVSPAFMQLLNKMALHSVRSANGRRVNADEAFRELVRRLIDDWDLDQTQQHLPELYGDRVQQLPDLPDDTSGVWAYAPEPERLVLMSIESGLLEAGTLRAVDMMIAKGSVPILLNMLADLPDDPVAKVLRQRVYHPRTIAMLLSADPIDVEILARLIPESGLEAAELLLDGLATTKDRKTRAKLIELVASYGADIGPELVARIPGAPWYVQRNLLHLLGMLPALPPEFTPELCLAHHDPRVRHEGLKLLLREESTRERAILEAVRAPDHPSLRLGLVAALEGVPPSAVPIIVTRLEREDLPDDLTALALRSIGAVDDEAVLRCLLRHAVDPRKILWLWRFRTKSPAVIEAVTSLAMHWRYHPEAARVLARAAKHRDKHFREAAGAHPRMRTDEDDPRLKVIV